MFEILPKKPIAGRGAVSNRGSRYLSRQVDETLRHDDPDRDREDMPRKATRLHREVARSIVSRNQSPDVPFEQSINPYRGCEHGCIYCFARPTHTRLGLSAGLDFETEIYWKPDAARLLDEEFLRPSYRPRTIHLGANTDPYQPVEKRLGLTRTLLERFWEYRHPVTVLTKSALIERDVDLLAALAGQGLTRVAFSVTTLNDSLKRTLEPRAASAQARLRAMRVLADAGVPVSVMIAPVIPRVTDLELEDLLQAARQAGATRAGWILLRLPLEVEPLMREWLEIHRPDSVNAIFAILGQSHGGRPYDSRFHHRQQGAGAYAAMLRQRFDVTTRRLGFQRGEPDALDVTAFRRPIRGCQLALL
jgi:DNA repair photolyase